MSGSPRSRITTSAVRRLDVVERLLAGVDPLHVVALALEGADERERDVLLVLDDQDSLRHVASIGLDRQCVGPQPSDRGTALADGQVGCGCARTSLSGARRPVARARTNAASAATASSTQPPSITNG